MGRKMFEGTEKNINLILALLVLVLANLICAGCSRNSEYYEKAAEIKQEALEYLEDAYGEKFVIKDIRYIGVTEVWELTAAPEDKPEWDLIVKTGGKYGNLFYDDYKLTKWYYQSIDFYKPVVKKIFQYKDKVYMYSNAYVDIERNEIIDLSEALERYPEKTDVNLFIYLFEDVITEEEKKEEFLGNVMELLEYLRGQKLKYAMIEISIFDEEFFRNKDLDFIIKETNFFHKGSTKLEYSALEYMSYEVYGLRISRNEYNEINSIEDIENEIYVSNMDFLRK